MAVNHRVMDSSGPRERGRRSAGLSPHQGAGGGYIICEAQGECSLTHYDLVKHSIVPPSVREEITGYLWRIKGAEAAGAALEL